MTLQTAFDRNWQHFIVEQQPAATDVSTRLNGKTEPTCFYQTPAGHCCGIGILFPQDVLDNIKTENLNTQATVRKLFQVCPTISAFFAGLRLEDLQELQGCHDAAALVFAKEGVMVRTPEQFRIRMEQGLRDFARIHRLAVPGSQESEKQDLSALYQQ